jgi:hypothetical protein
MERRYSNGSGRIPLKYAGFLELLGITLEFHEHPQSVARFKRRRKEEELFEEASQRPSTDVQILR